MNNQPQFKIHGDERRKLKHELAQEKSYLKNFWHYHTLDKDMASIYGGFGGFPMSDERAEEIYNQHKEKVDKLEKLLSEPFKI